MLYISNAFSLSMLDRLIQKSDQARIPRPVEDPYDFVRSWGEDVVSIIGHADVADLFSKELGVNLAHNRATIQFNEEDVLLVGQYIGPRLPEGTTELPEGAKIEWWSV